MKLLNFGINTKIVIGFLIIVSAIPVAFAGMNLLTNPGFTNGTDGLDGWTTESFDEDGLAAAPLVQVFDGSPGPDFAGLDVYSRDSGAFSPFTALSQRYTGPSDGRQSIGWDMTFGTGPDPGETVDPDRDFDDEGVISLFNEDEVIFMALVSAAGVTLDPDGQLAAQGLACSDEPSDLPGFDRRIDCDVDVDTSTNDEATLFFGLSNEADGQIPFLLISDPIARPRGGGGGGGQIPLAAFSIDDDPRADPAPGVTGKRVQLDGTLSSDAETADEDLTYSWSLTTPSGSSSTIARPTADMTSFVPDMAGTYTVTLVVNDGFQDSAAKTKTVTVADNMPPTADAGMPQTLTLPASGMITIMLDATGSDDPDGDNSKLKYDWKVTTRPPGASQIITGGFFDAMTSYDATIAGTYVFEVKVTDELGATDTATVTVIVNPTTVNPPPMVDADFTPKPPVLSMPVTLDAGATDPGDTLTYVWTLTTPPGSTATLDDPMSATPKFTPDVAGDYSAEVTVTDTANPGVTDTVAISVAAAPVNEKPDVEITTPDGMRFKESDPLTFTGTASDKEDGDLTPTITWTIKEKGSDFPTVGPYSYGRGNI